MPLSERMFEALETYKNSTAIKIDDRKLSFSSLNKMAMSVAAFLLENNYVNANVGIISEPHFSAYAGILAAIYSGSAYVPLDLKQSDRRMVEILRDSKIEVIIADRSSWAIIQKRFRSLSESKYILFPEENGSCLLAMPGTAVHSEMTLIEGAIDLVEVKSSKNAYIMFTSGSTGKPKGVQVTRDNLETFLLNMNEYCQPEPGYISAQCSDLSFDVSVFQIFFPLLTGGTNTLIPEEEKYCPSEFIKRESISLWCSVPTMAVMMNKLSVLEDGCFPSINYSMFAGEPLTRETADAWRKAAPNGTLENYYGPTETTIFISRYLYSKLDRDRTFNNNIVPIGQPLKGHNLVLIDNKNNKIIDTNQKGELIVEGRQVTNGYVNDGATTAENYVTMPWSDKDKIWYKTGDIAMYNKYGDLEYIGRDDTQIKIAGRRIEIGEIESALRGKIKGGDAIIIPARDQIGIVQYLTAYVTERLDDDDIRGIRDSCVGIIDNIFFPKQFLFIESIPTTTSGKVDRKKLERNAEQASLVQQKIVSKLY